MENEPHHDVIKNTVSEKETALCGLRESSVLSKVQLRWINVKAAVSISVIHQSKRKTYEKIRERALQDIQAKNIILESSKCDEDGEESATDVKREGNIDLYSRENLIRRAQVKRNPDVIAAIRLFWNILDLLKDDSGAIDKTNYILLNRKLHIALVPDVTSHEAEQSPEVDWQRDTNDCNSTMDFDCFFESMFELADVWVEDIDTFEYIAFLDKMLDAIANGMVGELHFRPDDQVKRLVTTEFLDTIEDDEEEEEEALPSATIRRRRSSVAAFKTESGWGNMGSSRRLSIVSIGGESSFPLLDSSGSHRQSLASLHEGETASSSSSSRKDSSSSRSSLKRSSISRLHDSFSTLSLINERKPLEAPKQNSFKSKLHDVQSTTSILEEKTIHPGSSSQSKVLLLKKQQSASHSIIATTTSIETTPNVTPDNAKLKKKPSKRLKKILNTRPTSRQSDRTSVAMGSSSLSMAYGGKDHFLEDRSAVPNQPARKARAGSRIKLAAVKPFMSTDDGSSRKKKKLVMPKPAVLKSQPRPQTASDFSRQRGGTQRKRVMSKAPTQVANAAPQSLHQYAISAGIL